MEENKTKISFMEFLDDIKANDFEEEVINWHGREIVIRKRLTLDDIVSFEQLVSGNCFNKDNNEYLPEIEEYFIRYMTIKFYTNIEMDNDLDNTFYFLFASDIYNLVLQKIDIEQHNNLIYSIHKKIKTIISSRTFEILNKLNEMSGQMNSVNNQLLDSIDKDDLEKFIKAIGDVDFINNVTPETIVKSVVSARESET